MRVLVSLVLLAVTGTSFSSVVPRSPAIGDVDVISRYWGQISSYEDNKPEYFGIKDVGLPDGCGIEQVHVLHRYAMILTVTK